jgi:putative transposase
VRVRYGSPRIHILLRREGWAANRKRVDRLYRLEGLSLRRKRPRRHVTAARRLEREIAAKPNQQWPMDFVSDALFDGRRSWALTLEALAIVVDGGIRGEHVVQAVEQGAARRGAPELIRVDHGPEFVSKVLVRWAHERGVTLDFSRPGKPSGNCFVEALSRRGDGTIMRAGLTVRWGS